MVEIGRSPRQIGWPIPPTGTSYRVIGADGFERDMSDLADWIAAIQSGVVEAQSLFLDRETLRWRPVSELAIFIEAEQAVATDAVGVGGRQPESGPAVTRESAPGFENASKRAPSTTFLWMALVTAVVIVLAVWAAGSTLPANVQTMARQVPEPVRIGAAAVLFVILSEEFYWFVSILVGIRSVRPARRFALQVLALLTTCVLLYAVFALFSTDGFQLDAGFLVRNAVVVGLAYAASLFFWSIALLAGTSATLARKLLASAIVSAMLASTAYMGLAPIVRHGGAAPSSFCGSCAHSNSQPG
ncbi:hypothetical protein AYJ54_02525 [Bradyrhizobium centrolobii]|uniref:Uncharacterized protein n=1 Tax=Bradyrhizobium centrolobii TaxID=1505087 RepID=A0A176YHK5_9BRAD|nr:hypothetical protein [Bradyrhizobium centrolobii]OAF05787.1 hypothetical protein AYJ54_02525 [Bradyrhizobium centrolobii]